MSKEFKLTYIRDRKRNPLGCLMYSIKDHQIKWQLSTVNIKRTTKLEQEIGEKKLVKFEQKRGEEFNCKIGREKCLWRFMQRPNFLTVSSDNTSVALGELFRAMTKDSSVPERIKRAIKRGWPLSRSSEERLAAKQALEMQEVIQIQEPTVKVIEDASQESRSESRDKDNFVDLYGNGT